MSLRKGKLLSRAWSPPTLRDDWLDDAQCAGMMDDMIPAAICGGCPVRKECAALFVELDERLADGTQRAQRMVGTYGGVEHPHKPDHPSVGNKGGGRYPKGVQPVNGGACADSECERRAYRRGMCSMHYQRMMRARTT